LKILEVCSAFYPSRGGLERCVWELSNRFIKAGHDVTVITSSRGRHPKAYREKIGRLSVIRFPERFHFFEAPLLPHIAVEAMTQKFDVMHVHGMSPTITDFSVVAGKLKGKPVVLTYHNDIESDYGGLLGRVARRIHYTLSSPVVGLSDVVVATTNSYGRTSPVLRRVRKGFEVIPMGVTPRSRRQGRSVIEAGDDQDKRLLFVGQLRDYKGVDYLLQAVANLRMDSMPVTLDVVGTGPSLPSLKARVRELGISDFVEFRGHVEEESLHAYYEECDLFVLPSVTRREAFGIVQLEAMAAGAPIVASDIPGVNELAIRGGGRLAKPADAESLTAAIRESLSAPMDPALNRQLVEAHSWDVVADRYMELFGSLVHTERA
jgi:glycosyltransferase involved in cell wall biosynthesis